MKQNEEYKYMVATRCFTFNHAPYIEDALRGFSMQETSFPVVYIIVDDASTDGEPEIIRHWADENLTTGDVGKLWRDMPYGQLCVATLKGKPTSTFAILLLKENHYTPEKRPLKFDYISEWYDNAKYHALCEGDDYWIHPKKLQMQVDFMESHRDYVMCHTDFDLSNGQRRNHFVRESNDDNYFPQIIQSGLQVGTATTFILREAFQRTPKLNQGKGWTIGDLPMWIELSHEGKFKYIPKVTTSYRVLNDSASHGSLEKELSFAKSSVEIRNYYARYYGIDLPHDGYGKGYYTTIMKCAYKHKSKETAKNCLKEAARRSIRMNVLTSEGSSICLVCSMRWQRQWVSIPHKRRLLYLEK